MAAINASEITLAQVLAQLTNPGTLNTGQKTVAAAATAQALTGASTPLVVGVTVKALSINGDPVYVGIDGVTNATGFELLPGEQIFIPINNLATVFVKVTTNGEGVSFMAN